MLYLQTSNMKNFIITILSSILLISCSKYQRLLKSSDVELKYEGAVKYYAEEEYNKAFPLLEEILPLYRGSDKSEELNFYYAYCNYYLNDFILAGYHFQKFYNIFPLSERAEDAMFMSAYCYYLISPVYTLDQSNTYEAIEEFQKFGKNYPTSELSDSALVLMNNLLYKLEIKSYENAKLHFTTENYKAAIVAFDNFLKDYPNTEYDEEVNFYVLKSSFLLAKNSVNKKKEERINNTIDAYYNFVDNFDDEKYLKESENMYDQILKEREKLITKK